MTGTTLSFRLSATVLTALMWLQAVPQLAFAVQAADGVAIENVAAFRHLPVSTPIALSPDGERIAYVVEGGQRSKGAATALMSGTGHTRTEVHVAGVRAESLHVVSPRGMTTWAPSWSPDGSELAFLAYDEQEDAAHVWVFSTATNTTRQVSRVAVWTAWLRQRPAWTSDGKRIVIKVVRDGFTTAEMRTAAQVAPDSAPDGELEGEASVRVLRSQAESSEEATRPGWIEWRYGGDLAVIDLDSGEATRLTRDATPFWWQVSPAGDKIAFTAFDRIAQGVYPEARLGVAHLGADGDVWYAPGRVRQAYLEGFSWSPEGDRLAYLNAGDGADSGLFLVEVGTRLRRRIAGHRSGWSRRFGPSWAPDGASLYLADGRDLWRVTTEHGVTREVELSEPTIDVASVIRTMSSDSGAGYSLLLRVVDSAAGESGLALVDSDGRILSIRLEPGTSGRRLLTDASQDGAAIVTSYEATRFPPELWLLDESLHRSRRVSSLNPGVRPQDLGTGHLIRWTDGDTHRKALLLLPAGESRPPEEPLPIVVDVYGGRPVEPRLDEFYLLGQFLASRGYAVLVPEIRLRTGSTLEGHADAVLPAVDHMVDLGVADPDRLGVYGHSFGGYGVLALLVRTNRFRAAVASAAQGDLIGMFGRLGRDGSSRSRWVVTGQGDMGGTPWTHRERYIENSPIFFLDRVETPLLLLHGAEDPSTPVHLAQEIFGGLQELGHEVVLAEYLGEGHWWGQWAVENQIDYLERLVGWFDEHFGSEPR